jgi:hypothetical protein
MSFFICIDDVPTAVGGPVVGGPPNVQNTKNLLWVISGWIPFFWQKAVFWVLCYET